MSEINEAAVSLGLALFRRTVLNGAGYYSVYDLVFDENNGHGKQGFLGRVAGESNFWGLQQEAARILDGSGIAQVRRTSVAGSGMQDFSLDLTPLGRSIYSMAHFDTDQNLELIEGISFNDVVRVLSDEAASFDMAHELRRLDDQLNYLALTNHQRATVSSYLVVLTAICEMPDRDTKLFWTVLERMNQFAGVASLIVAILAMRFAR